MQLLLCAKEAFVAELNYPHAAKTRDFIKSLTKPSEAGKEEPKAPDAPQAP